MTSKEPAIEIDDPTRTYVIGREPECDIVIKDPLVSRRHALIADLGGGHYHIADQGSANGVALLREGQWQPVKEADVRADDRLRLGDHVVSVAALFEPPPLASDIFISYSSADREQARHIARMFEEKGWVVWWDQVIPPGKDYDEVIEEQVANARCVVVLWSKTSVASRWVRAEADDAMTRGVLIPVLVDDTAIPLVFRQLQAANLIDWDGSRDHNGIARLITAVEVALDPDKVPDAEQVAKIRQAEEQNQGPGVTQGRASAPRRARTTEGPTVTTSATQFQLTKMRFLGILLTAFAVTAVWAIPGTFAREAEGWWLFRVSPVVMIGCSLSVLLATPLSLKLWIPQFTMAQFWGMLGALIAGVAAMVTASAGICAITPDGTCGTPTEISDLVLNIGLREIPESLIAGAVLGYFISQVVRGGFPDNGGPGYVRRMIVIWMTTATVYAIAIFLVSSVYAALVQGESENAFLHAHQDARMVADTVMMGMTWALGLFLTIRFGPKMRLSLGK